MIRVVIADDHHMVRQGIRSLLEKDTDITVVGEADDGYGALQLVGEMEPDVLVIDMAMPRLNGLQALAQLHRDACETRVIVLSMYSDETLVRKAIQSGASGYLLKRSVSGELLTAVRAAARGQTYLSPDVEKFVTDVTPESSTEAAAADPLERLTRREMEVLKLVAEGHTNREIGHIMSISIKTVEKHRANLMEKLDIHDLSGLIRFAIKHHLITLDTFDVD